MADDTAREEDHEPGANGGEPVSAPVVDEPASAPLADEVAAAVVARFAGSVFVESHGQSVVYVDRAVMADVALLLRDDEQFTMLVDTVVVDHLLDGSRVSVAHPDARRLARPPAAQGRCCRAGPRDVQGRPEPAMSSRD